MHIVTRACPSQCVNTSCPDALANDQDLQLVMDPPPLCWGTTSPEASVRTHCRLPYFWMRDAVYSTQVRLLAVHRLALPAVHAYTHAFMHAACPVCACSIIGGGEAAWMMCDAHCLAVEGKEGGKHHLVVRPPAASACWPTPSSPASVPKARWHEAPPQCSASPAPIQTRAHPQVLDSAVSNNGGYDIAYQNSYITCDGVVQEECLRQKRAEICVTELQVGHRASGQTRISNAVYPVQSAAGQKRDAA